MFVLLTLSILGLLSAPLMAEDAVTPPATSTAAAQVQAFYDRSQSFEARFKQSYTHALYKRTDRSSGHVVFASQGRMRWDYDKPAGKVIVADGKQLTLYEPGEEGEPGYYVRQELAEAQLSLAMGFLTGKGKLMRDFRVTELDAKQAGYPQGKVIDLRPRTPTPYFDRMLLYVLKAPTPGVIQRVLIVDASGNRNRFDFDLKSLRFAPKLSPKRFRFVPPKNARRINP